LGWISRRRRNDIDDVVRSGTAAAAGVLQLRRRSEREWERERVVAVPQLQLREGEISFLAGRTVARTGTRSSRFLPRTTLSRTRSRSSLPLWTRRRRSWRIVVVVVACSLSWTDLLPLLFLLLLPSFRLRYLPLLPALQITQTLLAPTNSKPSS